MAEVISAQPLPTSRHVSELLSNIKQEVTQVQQQMTSQVQQQNGDKTMAEVMTPNMILGAGSSGGDGLFGSGGGGLIGGLILGSLLRNNGNLFGGPDGAGAAMGAVLRNPPEQNQANMDLMAGIGAVDKAVAVSTAAMEGSQAAQTAAINASLNSVASSLVTRIDGTKEAVNAGTMVLAQQLNALNTNLMSTANETQKTVTNDGDKTRALITQQYEMNLQRQLADANAALAELRTEGRLVERTRGVEVTTTNNINQMQQQQQTQQQFAQLGNYIALLAQQIRSNNEAINVGSGTLTANPTNTNTNIR
ncbi:MAG: hypothetical protein ACKOXV_04665 [Bacteroidota bacterium]